MTVSELKPCPFCGANPRLTECRTYNELEDLKRRLVNLQKDVTTIVCGLVQIKEAAREIPVPPTEDEYPECPVCMCDVDEIDKREGRCQNCGQRLKWSER